MRKSLGSDLTLEERLQNQVATSTVAFSACMKRPPAFAALWQAREQLETSEKDFTTCPTITFHRTVSLALCGRLANLVRNGCIDALEGTGGAKFLVMNGRKLKAVKESTN